MACSCQNRLGSSYWERVAKPRTPQDILEGNLLKEFTLSPDVEVNPQVQAILKAMAPTSQVIVFGDVFEGVSNAFSLALAYGLDYPAIAAKLTTLNSKSESEEPEENESLWSVEEFILGASWADIFSALGEDFSRYLEALS